MRLAGVIAPLALPSVSLANTFTWSGGDGSGFFSAAGDWSPTGPPPSGSDLIFGSQNIYPAPPVLDTSYSANSLTFNPDALPFNFGGANGLTLGSGGLTDNASATESFTNPITLTASQTWNIAGPVILSNTLTSTGSAGLIKTGAGVLSLNGGGTLATLSDQAGPINLSSGSYTLSATTNNLQVGGGATLTLNNATLDASAETSAALIDGPTGTGMVVSGSLAQFKAGNLDVGYSNNASGSLTLSSGAHVSAGTTIVSYRGVGNLSITSGATLTSTSSTLSYNGTGVTASVSGTGSTWYAGQSLNFGISGGMNAAKNLNISSGGSVVVSGPTTFNTSNTGYGGVINVNGGTLVTGGLVSGSPYDGNMNLTDPATGPALTLGDSLATDSYTYSGYLNGTGSLLKTGASTQILTYKSAFGGNINVTGGTLNIYFTGASSFQVSTGALAVTNNDANSPAFVNAGGILSGAATYPSITLNAGGAYLPGTYNNSFSLPSAATALIQPAAPGNTSTSVPLILNADTTVNVAASTDVLTLASPLRAAVTLTRTGPGTLILTANNSLGSLSIQGGNTNISAGSFALTSNAAQSLAVTGGVVTVNNGISLTTVGGATIGGAAGTGVTVTGNKSVLSVAQEFDIGVNSIGILSLQNNGSAAALTTFNVGCPAGVNISSGATLTTSTANIATSSNSTIASVYLMGQGSTWLATNLNLGATPGSSGGTDVVNLNNYATLNVSAGTYLGSSHAEVNVSNGSMYTGWLASPASASSAILEDYGAITINDTAAGDLNTYYGVLYGPDILAKTGASTQVLAGSLIYDGTINLSAGTLAFSNSAANNSFGTLNITGGVANFSAGTYAVTSRDSISMQGGILIINGAILDSSTGYITEPGGSNPLISVTGPGTLLKTTGIGMGPNTSASLNISQGASALMTGTASLGKLGSIWVSNATLTATGLVSSNNSNASVALTDPAGAVALSINGSSGINTFSGAITGTGSITKSGGSTQILSGSDTFTGSVAVSAGILAFSKINHFSSLGVTGGTAVFNGAGNVLVVPTVSVTGSGAVDLTSDAADISSTPLPTIVQLVTNGFNSGRWNGSGIISSIASVDTAHLTAVGVIQNNQNGLPLYSATSLFENLSPGAADVLLKYTYYGDTNLDGKVDASDYTRIDSGFLTAATGWFNGDFNYDGTINGSDYTLIDNAFDRQGAQLTAQLAKVSAQTSGSSVPEPALSVTGCIAAMGLLRRRSPSCKATEHHPCLNPKT